MVENDDKKYVFLSVCLSGSQHNKVLIVNITFCLFSFQIPPDLVEYGLVTVVRSGRTQQIAFSREDDSGGVLKLPP